MVGISEIKKQIMKAQKVRHPSKADLNNSTMDLSQIEEKYKSLFELPSLQSGEAFLDSEEKFSKVFRSSPDAIAITTCKDGKFIEVNDSYTRITGYTREEVIGRSSAELGLWVKAEGRTRILRILKEQGRVRYEKIHMRMKSGEEQVGLFSAEPIDIDGEPCMISVVVDITELKRAEEALAKEAIWRRILIDQSSDGIVILDQNGKVYEANRRFAEMLGYSSEEVRQLYVWDWEFLYPREKVMSMIRSVDETGDHFETKHLRKDGTVYDVEISTNGAVFDGQKLIFCVCRDITEIKRAGEALKQRAQILDSATDSIFLHDFDGNFIYVNETACRNHGYSREEFMKMKLPQVVAPERVSRLDLDFQEILEKGQVIFESTHLRKDGSIMPVEVHPRTIESSRGKLILAVIRDITERKRAEEELQTTLKTALDGFWRTNFEGKLLEVNDSYCRMIGYTREELLNMSTQDVEAVDSPEEIAQRIEKIVKQGSDRFETQHKRKDGKTIDVEMSINYLDVGEGQFFIFARDITERKRAEEALRESEEKYRDLLDNTSDLIQSVTPDGHFRYVNNGWRRVLGYSEEEISNLTIFDILHPDCLQNYRMLFQKIKLGEEVGRINATLVSRNGSKIIVEGNVTGKYVNGELIYTRSILRNITKNKYLEEQMFRLSSAVSMSTDCMVITDLDAKIIDANQKILEMYGADSKEELLGRHFLELIVPAERVKVSMDVSEIMEKGSLECQEYNMVSKQGSKFPVQMSTSLVRDADGKPMGMVRVGRELGKLN